MSTAAAGKRGLDGAALHEEGAGIITCNFAGRLRPIDCEEQALPSKDKFLLTEVFCFEVFGSCLSPDDLNGRCNQLGAANEATWGDPDGPVAFSNALTDMLERPHRFNQFEAMHAFAAGGDGVKLGREEFHARLMAMHPNSDTLPANYHGTVAGLGLLRGEAASYAAARDWMDRLRFGGKGAVATMSREDAIRHARSMADQQLKQQEEIAAKVTTFLQRLSGAIFEGKVVLSGRCVDLLNGFEISDDAEIVDRKRPLARSFAYNAYTNELTDLNCLQGDRASVLQMPIPRKEEVLAWQDVWLPHSHALEVLSEVPPESKCRIWLRDEMRKSLHDKQKPKAKWRSEGRAKFDGLSGRGFDSAWDTAISITGSTWDEAGAPRKSARK